MNERDERLATDPEAAARLLLDDVADHVIAQVIGQKLRQQPDAEPHHVVGSSPMSTPADMRCSVRSDAWSERLPAGVTA